MTDSKNPKAPRINSAPEGFHTLWGQCKDGIYEKQAWNEYQQKLCIQTKRLLDLEEIVSHLAPKEFQCPDTVKLIKECNSKFPENYPNQ